MRFFICLSVSFLFLFLHSTSQAPHVAAAVHTRTVALTATPLQDDYSRGLREALLNGTYSAIRSLGREGGFLRNLRVRIPMPKPLQPVEKTLRLIGQGGVADDFIAAMNHAAEKAVPASMAASGKPITAFLTRTRSRNAPVQTRAIYSPRPYPPG